MTSRYGTLLRSSRSALSSGGNPFKSAGSRPSVPSTARPPLLSSHRNQLANDTANFRAGFTSSSRIPVELGSAMSIISLHSTVAASRPTSPLVHANPRACSALAYDATDGT
uniref:Uncharacterized protein n=1 Tax=Picea sitchensis TaxID=3332 RepID=A9NM22_PICSI|nr:unknown [Picea sitchensis]